MSNQLSDYEVLGVIGEGSFAKVSKVKRKSTGQILVWKELKYANMSDKEKQMLCDEVNILRQLNHPNIVRCSTYLIDHKMRKIFIIQEFCDGGDLATYIKNKKNKKQDISENFIWSILSEIASALKHCHSTHDYTILHRDLKPSNIFLCRRGNSYSVKLGDFGLAKVLNNSLFTQTHVGTPYYMSPEQIHQRNYNHQSDVWSLGAVIYELAMLSPPFRAASYVELASKIQGGKYPPLTNKYSKDLRRVVDLMLQMDVTKRCTVDQILALPRVNLQLKTIRLERRYLSLKKKEMQIKSKEKELRALEHRLALKEVELLNMEGRLEREKSKLLLCQRSADSRFSTRSSSADFHTSADSQRSHISSVQSLSFYSDMTSSSPALGSDIIDNIN